MLCPEPFWEQGPLSPGVSLRGRNAVAQEGCGQFCPQVVCGAPSVGCGTEPTSCSLAVIFDGYRRMGRSKENQAVGNPLQQETLAHKGLEKGDVDVTVQAAWFHLHSLQSSFRLKMLSLSFI